MLIYRCLRNAREPHRFPMPSIENPRVDGSIPPLATRFLKATHRGGLFASVRAFREPQRRFLDSSDRFRTANRSLGGQG